MYSLVMTRPYRSPSILEYSFLISLVAQVQLNGWQGSGSEETVRLLLGTQQPTAKHRDMQRMCCMKRCTKSQEQR